MDYTMIGQENLKETMYCHLEEFYRSLHLSYNGEEVITQENEDLIKHLLELMDIPYHNTVIEDLIFSDKIKCIITNGFNAAYYRGMDRPESEEIITDDPVTLFDDPEESSGEDSRIIVLGEYYPNSRKIVLYYRAIISYTVKILCNYYKNTDINSHSFRNYIENALLTMFTIVYAHEYFHAVHHQNGDFCNATVLLQESLARYFELLYCSVCPFSRFAKEVAGETRRSLKRSPHHFMYKGALTFDSLLGTEFPDIVKTSDKLLSMDRYYMGYSSLQNIIAPQYHFLHELFMHSDFRGDTFEEFHDNVTD